jgi:hypothetical protein
LYIEKTIIDQEPSIMKTLFSFGLLFVFLILPDHLTAQQPKLRLGSAVAPSESYVFVDLDAMLIPGYFAWAHGALSIGYQHNAFVGFGGHLAAVANPNNEYYGLGISYRLAYKFLECRVDAGMLANYKVWDDNCFHEYRIRNSPYGNVFLGFWVLRVVRMGAYFSLVPPTIKSTVACFSGSILTSVKEEKLGSLYLLPSIGISIPLYRQ